MAANVVGSLHNKLVSSEAVNITGLLRAWRGGDRTAVDRLTPLVYDQLRRLASNYAKRERAGHDLQTTALVHEAYLRLAGGAEVNWQDRVHFFAVAARIIRRILVDAARRRTSAKRGGGVEMVDHDGGPGLDAIADPRSHRAMELDQLDDALRRLTELDPRRAQVVELRFFGGLTVEEVAEVMRVSPRTVAHDWALARAWLTRELRR
jgi:RNA polymerase sigma-70 factor (ECF subfamily)